MKKETLIRVAICLLFLVMIVWLVACGVPVDDKTEDQIELHTERVGSMKFSGMTKSIYKCVETGVLYVYEYHSGVSVLLNADGTPMLWED